MDSTKKLKEILSDIKYASMASVNEDGSPHNSPLLLMYEENLKYIFWGSHPDSQHSKNILRTGQAFFSIFNSQNGGTGLYIQISDGKIVEGDDLVEALKIHNRFRQLMGKNAIDMAYYQGESPQKMWRGKVEKIWINAYQRGENGKLVKDYKIEIPLEEVGNLW